MTDDAPPADGTERCWCWLIEDESGHVSYLDSMGTPFIEETSYEVTIAWWWVETDADQSGGRNV